MTEPNFGSGTVRPNPISKRTSVVDVKQMCKTFENLSDKDDPKAVEKMSNIITEPTTRSQMEPINVTENRKFEFRASNMPKPPARKNKNRNSRVEACSNDPSISDTSNNTVGGVVSVRDRMKVFEHSSRSDCNATSRASAPTASKRSDGGKVHIDSSGVPKALNDIQVPVASSPAPLKPPRVMNAYLQTKGESQLKELEPKAGEEKVKFQLSSSYENECARSQSSSGPPLPTKSSSNSPFKGEPSLQNKLPKVPSKSSAFKSCLKHVSNTASQIRDKVKNKSSGMFVDLTPTTVSPPKSYGTLKRSHSEEHIYAEPFVQRTREVSAAARVDSSLHYMCSPVIDLPNQERKIAKQEEELADSACTKSKISKSSIRNIIYESFSLLRRPAIGKLPETTDRNDPSGDNESDVSVKDVQDRIIYVKSVKKQMSVSSICISPKLFEVVLIIDISSSGPQVVFKHPRMPKKNFDYPLIPHLCFPDFSTLEKSSVYKSETFHFTLEVGDDEKIFGYCHRLLWPKQNVGFCTNSPVAICLLSSVSAPLFYKKILCEIEKHMSLPIKQCMEYLMKLRKLGIPNAGASLSIPDDTEKESKQVIVTRPLDSHIVSLDLTRCVQLLDVDVLLNAVASLLLERRVLLLSHFSRNLFQCCGALTSVLYPLQWQHLIIPVVPSCLLVQCCSESPYLLGIVSDDYDTILDLLGEHQLLIIDVDAGAVLKSCGDEETILPKKVRKAVSIALNLSKNMTDPTEMMRDIMISEAMVHMFVEMLGHAGNYFVGQDESLTFQKEAFQKNCSAKSIQSFLQWFSESQMFEAFVDEYIWRINYRKMSQSQQFTFFEKRVDEYKWELAYENDKICRKIGKTVRNLGEKLKNLRIT